ncbi:MAG: glycosyltransferase family A protein, partial [Clostridia bacterium]
MADKLMVVIPCYNHESFVQDSIQSVIDQSYQNIELIIIDDGSKDGSVEKIKEMLDLCEERFIRFKFISRENRGISVTLNEAIRWSKGEYWAICSSDDFYHYNKIEKQVTLMHNDKNIAL